ncbi:MAG: hypothetical protein ACOYJS_02625 [Acutalibacteraceae bacterium]|jgi:hypothetical protein
MIKTTAPARRVSQKLAKIISNSLTVSEIKLYNRAERADSISFDALYLWVLKNHYGFSAKELINTFKEVSVKARQYKDYTLSGQYIPPVDELKSFGVDIEQLSKEAGLWQ